jgi:MoxR-like ATPase
MNAPWIDAGSTTTSSPTNTTITPPLRTATHRGLSIWRRALLKGHLPTKQDFLVRPDDVASLGNNDDDDGMVVVEEEDLIWPSDRILFDTLMDQMIQLQLPRFVQRHPEMIQSVLFSILRLVDVFRQQQQEQLLQRQEQQEQQYELARVPMETNFYSENENIPPLDVLEKPLPNLPMPWTTREEILRWASDTVATELHQEFGHSMAGIQILDQLFGYTTTTTTTTTNGLPIDINNNNSLWHHTGWTMIPALQRQLQNVPALRRLLQSLGRRSTTVQSDGQYHKFRPRQFHPHGSMMHAVLDPLLARTTLSGLTRSNRYSEMLPAEAMLLKGSSNVLRRLFYAKLVESQLLSYEFTGWTDDTSVSIPPTPKKPRYQRTPSARGGPILICLDTSYSMSTSNKESISKAVVLACVSAAHRQHRTCRLVAFGARGTMMDAGDCILRPDADGIRNLLDFLAHSFGGGTDVTGALQHAITLLDPSGTTAKSTQTNVNDDIDDTYSTMSTVGLLNEDISEISAADLLLITDGEIPDPPVSIEMMDQLHSLRQHTALQVHGILVGYKKNSDANTNALEKICTHIHDFLLDFDIPNTVSPGTTKTTTSVSSLHMMKRDVSPRSIQRTMSFRNSRTELFGRKFDDDAFDDLENVLLDNDNSYDKGIRTISKLKDRRGSSSIPSIAISSTDISSYVSRVENSLEGIKSIVATKIKDQAWDVSKLEEEKNSEGSCWRYRQQFREAVNRVGENLIERDVEARLVVLGMVAGEHVLFLGPPGTGKSVLGRRLSMICGGVFFQRLFTRFTTPEEIFGPLSLRALENDEYRRITNGFLPTASVAFLDEIFKANSAILNTLLTILNERQFDNGAGCREDCPIRCVIAASNELPESDELDALYDRFLLRKEVLPVSDDGVVQLLSTVLTPGKSPCDDDSRLLKDDIDGKCDVIFADGLDRIVQALSIAADSVHIDSHISYLLRDLRIFLRDEMNVNMSDRRLVKAARLLKVVAASHGRKRVDPIDCLLLQHVAWSLPEHRDAIREWLWDNITPGSVTNAGREGTMTTTSQYNLLLNGLRQTSLTAVRRTGGDVSGDSGARDSDVAVIASIRMEVSQVIVSLQKHAESLARHIELLRRSMDHLWHGPDEALASQQLLILPAEKALSETERLLSNACGLELSLMPDDSIVKTGVSTSLLSHDIRLSVIEQLWDDDDMVGEMLKFTENELNISMRETKAKYDVDTFRKWKRERKKAGIK